MKKIIDLIGKAKKIGKYIEAGNDIVHYIHERLNQLHADLNPFPDNVQIQSNEQSNNSDERELSQQ